MSGAPIEYTDGETKFTGYLVAGSASGGTGVLVFHGGNGLDDHARFQAERYAGLGHTVLAADLYGEGALASRETAMAVINALRNDRKLLSRRANSALKTLRSVGKVDGAVGVVGFCFGGMAALEYSRSGVDLAAAVSIHGWLATGRPAEPGAVKARLLVCHGAADPHVPMDQVTGFAAEMEAAGVAWELIAYGGAQHGFTHRDAVGPGSTPGVAYQERADRLSFERASAFIEESFNSSGPRG